jgi:hypothetical protein
LTEPSGHNLHFIQN